jgi:uncharacterized cupin superfamily protein
MKAVHATDIPGHTSTAYPEEFRDAVAGRLKRKLGDVFGLVNFGVNLTELAPGGKSALRHWHETEDEFVYVLSGELVLVTDEGEQILTPGMCAGFAAGVPNGHQLVNRGNAPATYLEIGDRSMPEKAHYPDEDLEARAEDGRWRFFHRDGRPYD